MVVVRPKMWALGFRMETEEELASVLFLGLVTPSLPLLVLSNPCPIGTGSPRLHDFRGSLWLPFHQPVASSWLAHGSPLSQSSQSPNLSNPNYPIPWSESGFYYLGSSSCLGVFNARRSSIVPGPLWLSHREPGRYCTSFSMLYALLLLQKCRTTSRP